MKEPDEESRLSIRKPAEGRSGRKFRIQVIKDLMGFMSKKQRKSRKEHKFLKFTYIKYTVLTMFLCLLAVPGYTPFVSEGINLYHVTLNGVDVGSVDREEKAEELLWKARSYVASSREGFTFLETELEVTGEEDLFGSADYEDLVYQKMITVLSDSVQETLQRAYTVKVNEYLVNLSSIQEVEELFQAAIDKYDENGEFRVKMVHAPQREFSVFTTTVESSKEEKPEEEIQEVSYEYGVQKVIGREGEHYQAVSDLGFDAYEYGVTAMDLVEDVEVIEAYLPSNQISTLEEAVEHLIAEQEVPVEYTIVPGDTLSEIALKLNIPMDQIVAMNSDILDSVNTPIHVGDKLVITVPEPELSVTRTETKYYEEIYDADTIYVDNDSWYTTQTVILQQPSAGFRKIAVEEHYVNDKVAERVILKQEILKEAVALKVERGTKIPPTYIKPLSGGRLSSGFGKRSAPTKGASTYHKGVDWSTPTGTSVVASCGGTVTKAGWASGYGYVVYIDHEDGRQTRYGHNSKVLVTVGQKVKQGEKIALSGSTGISSGPHVHFEILINGSQVDPLKYLN